MILFSACLLALPLVTPPAWAQDPVMPKDTEIVTTASGLKYSVLQPGTGPRPTPGSPVTVHYSGWLTDGTPFDSSVKRGAPFEFMLGRGGVIRGWDEGVALMQKGARYKFTIPSDLAYGPDGRPPVIPPAATLVFEVELLDFVTMPEFRPANPAAQVKLDSGLVYEELEPGAGPAPKPGQICELEYAVFSTSGKLIDCSAAQRRNIKDVTGESRMPFMNEIVPLMQAGARWRIEVPPALGFGQRPMGPDMPPGSVSVWELHVVSVVEPLAMPAFRALDPQRTQTTASGLKYEVVREGTGPSAKLGQEVTVHYAGWLLDGTPFDASFKRAEPFTFKVGGRVIKGWNEGLPLMKEGGACFFEIPSGLAYGPQGSKPNIPPNSTLVFYIELLPSGS